MIVAAVSAHLPRGFFAQNGGFEYTLVLGASGLALAFTGQAQSPPMPSSDGRSPARSGARRHSRSPSSARPASSRSGARRHRRATQPAPRGREEGARSAHETGTNRATPPRWNALQSDGGVALRPGVH